MTIDPISTQIKQMADRWDTPAFDPAAIAERSRARARSRRNRLAAGSAALILVAITVLIALITDLHDDTQPTAQRAATSPAARPTNPNSAGLAPAILPPVRVQPVSSTGRTVNGQQVLAETRAGSSVTLKARLFFLRHGQGRVTAAALVVCQPGTGPGVSPTTANSHYQQSRVALGPKVAATAPQQRILTVKAPAQLQPGRYPVLWVENTALLPGQQRGIRGPFTVSGQLGVLVVHPLKGP